MFKIPCSIWVSPKMAGNNLEHLPIQFEFVPVLYVVGCNVLKMNPWYILYQKETGAYRVVFLKYAE